MIIDKKFSSVTMLAERADVSELTLHSADKELYTMAILKQQLANTGYLWSPATSLFPGRRRNEDFAFGSGLQLNVWIVNQQIKAAHEKRGKL